MPRARIAATVPIKLLLFEKDLYSRTIAFVVLTQYKAFKSEVFVKVVISTIVVRLEKCQDNSL